MYVCVFGGLHSDLQNFSLVVQSHMWVVDFCSGRDLTQSMLHCEGNQSTQMDKRMTIK